MATREAMYFLLNITCFYPIFSFLQNPIFLYNFCQKWLDNNFISYGILIYIFCFFLDIIPSSFDAKMTDSWTMSPIDDEVDGIFSWHHLLCTSNDLFIEYLDVTEKKIRTYCDTTVTLTDRYPFFISLYKMLHRKGMDAHHCGVLVKTYNIF
jgi:hypothetical protein